MMGPSFAETPLSSQSSHLERTIEVTWLALTLVGIYTGVDLRLGGGLMIPYVVAGTAGAFFVLRLFRSSGRANGVILLLVPAVAAVGAVFAPAQGVLLFERVKGTTYLVFSLTIGFALFRYFDSLGRERVGRLFGWIVVLILFGCVLEDLTPLRTLSDAFRHAVFDPESVYVSDARDLFYAGMIRPKLFTEEPSYVGIFLTLSLYVWFLLTNNANRWVLYLVGLTVAFAAIRSPVALLGIPLGVVGEISRETHVTNAHTKSTRAGSLVLRWGVLTVAGAAGVWAFFIPRLQAVLAGRDLSTLTRIVAPLLLLRRVISLYPVWGIGVTSEEVILNPSLAGYRMVGLPQIEIGKIINAFWLIPTYFGIVGSAFIAMILYAFARSAGVRRVWLCAVAIALLMQSMGAFVGMRTWFTAFLVILAHSFVDGPAPSGHRVAVPSDPQVLMKSRPTET